MEIIEENKLKNETLGGVSLSSQPIDDPHKISNPSLDKNEVGGGGTVVVTTTTVVEKTEVSVVKMLQEDKDDILKNDEGVFGNLVDGHEGIKVNCSENGGSLGMNLEEFFGGENGSEVEPVFEGNAASLADEHDENAPGDPMDEEKEKNDENGTEIFESKDDINKNDENKHDGNAPGDSMDVCFSGQIEENNENRLHIFEWNDDENAEDNDKKLAENEEEYDEEEDESEEEEEEEHDFVVGDFVWGKIKSHPWWPGQIYDPSDASDYASTLKRKGRLLVAYFGDGSFSWCQPSQLKPFIDHFQEMSVQSDYKKFVNAVRESLEEISRLVEAELMCKCQPVNWVKNGGVMNSKKGVCVPKGNTVTVLMDGLQPVEVFSTLKDIAKVDPGTRQFELELEFAVLKSCMGAFYGQKGGYLLSKYSDPKCIEGLEDKTRSGSDKNGPSENGGDKLYQKRKKKSVAELLGEDEPKIRKTKMSKDGKTKRKALVVSVTPDESGGGTMSPRQRKRSKYLSPPYLSPIGGVKLSGFKEPKPEPEKVPEMAVEDSSQKSSGKRGSQKRKARQGSDSKEDPPKMIDASVNVNKVFQGLLHAALDPSSFVDKNLPVITDFISSFQSSIFKNGSSHRQATVVKKDGFEDVSDVAFIEQKLEWMNEMVQKCKENEMNADVKASLEHGIKEVLDKVCKMRSFSTSIY